MHATPRDSGFVTLKHPQDPEGGNQFGFMGLLLRSGSFYRGIIICQKDTHTAQAQRKSQHPRRVFDIVGRLGCRFGYRPPRRSR
jgi:hypothetical protein